MSAERVLLLTESSKWGEFARHLVARTGTRVEYFPWSWGEDRSRLDAMLGSWSQGAIICFKADCIVPGAALENASIAINFHPGPPWLRGVACPERAITRGDRVYGVTCHHMIEEVDAGKIVAVDTFGIPQGQSVAELRARVGHAMLDQLEHVWHERGSLGRREDKRDPIWADDILSVRRARGEGLI